MQYATRTVSYYDPQSTTSTPDDTPAYVGVISFQSIEQRLRLTRRVRDALTRDDRAPIVLRSVLLLISF